MSDAETGKETLHDTTAHKRVLWWYVCSECMRRSRRRGGKQPTSGRLLLAAPAHQVQVHSPGCQRCDGRPPQRWSWTSWTAHNSNNKRIQKQHRGTCKTQRKTGRRKTSLRPISNVPMARRGPPIAGTDIHTVTHSHTVSSNGGGHRRQRRAQGHATEGTTVCAGRTSHSQQCGDRRRRRWFWRCAVPGGAWRGTGPALP